MFTENHGRCNIKQLKGVTRFFCDYLGLLKYTVFLVSLHIDANFTYIGKKFKLFTERCNSFKSLLRSGQIFFLLQVERIHRLNNP